MVAAPAASAATPVLVATPSSGLADGQAITITAAHFPTNIGIQVVECDIQYGCDTSHRRVYYSQSTGGFTESYFVNRIIVPGGKRVDCAATGHCVLLANQYNNFAVGAERPIKFDPNTPIAPAQLSLSLSLDGTDGVVVSSGVAVLHGNLTCNRGAEVYVSGNMSQSHNGNIAQGYGSSELICPKAGTIPWQLSINPENQFFATGPAQVYVSGYAENGSSGVEAEANGTVILAADNLPRLIPSGAHVTVPAPGATVVLHYWILLSAPSHFPVTFSYSTLNGTASAPTDYVSASGNVTIPAGATKAIIPITINGTHGGPGTRHFVVSLTNPSNAALGSDHGRGTVTLTHH